MTEQFDPNGGWQPSPWKAIYLILMPFVLMLSFGSFFFLSMHASKTPDASTGAVYWIAWATPYGRGGAFYVPLRDCITYWACQVPVVAWILAGSIKTGRRLF